jgi:hypothetical protein
MHLPIRPGFRTAPPSLRAAAALSAALAACPASAQLPTLSIAPSPVVAGCSATVALTGEPFASFLIAVDAGPGPTAVPSVGVVQLDLGPFFFVAVDGPALGVALDAAGTWSATFPAFPGLTTSLTFYAQAATVGTAGLALSNGLAVAVVPAPPATFAPAVGALPVDFDFAEDVLAADVDDDGDTDVLVAVSGTTTSLPGGVRLLLNQGGVQGGAIGFFLDESATLPNGLPSALCLAKADVDGDGDLDVFAGADDSHAANVPNVLLIDQGGIQGGATGTFAPAPFFPAGAFETQSAAFVDVDSDGDADLLLGNGTDKATAPQPCELLLNDGLGGFVVDASFGAAAFNVAGETDGVAIGDYDFDGDPDALLVRDGDPLLLTNAGGYFVAASAQPATGLMNATAGTAGDFDLDGDLDVVVTVIGGMGDRLLVNDGAGTFSVQSLPASPSTVLRLGHAVADVDRDGDLDVVTAIHPLVGTETQFVHWNQGGLQGGVAGTFAASLIPGSPAGVCYAAAVFDADGDSDMDLYFGSSGFFGPFAADVLLVNAQCP